VAIVCDWLTSIGGAERVLLALHELYPNAPIYTSQYDPKQIDWFKKANIQTTWLQGLPKQSTVRKLLPVLRRQAFQNLNLKDYDIVISSSGAEAKSVKKLKKGAIHITYCHAPTHYYWSRYDEYLKEPGFGMLNPVARAGLRIFGGPMRKWDYKVAQRPDILIANSNHIKQKIKEYYNRDSILVYPPVDVDRFKEIDKNQKRSGLIVTGRQVPYKRIDLAIKAALLLKTNLKVVGNGPMHDKLKLVANNSPYIQFLNNVSDKQLSKLLATAELYLFPWVEDFGIAPLEAIACGTPVVAFDQGGALDYVNDTTGVLFQHQTAESLADAIITARNSKWDHTKISKQADKYSVENFKSGIQKIINSHTKI
jgi:glycosyltransferase involved in cell wall biosynthesis